MRRQPAILGIVPLSILVAWLLAFDSGSARAESSPVDSGCLAGTATVESADSWVFRQGRYSHDPATGHRVDQFAPKAPSLADVDPHYVRSGYRHKRSTLRGADGSADRVHVVETWGAGDSIRPYGEWQYPYRAGATPYGPWGNPQGPWTMPFDSWANPYGQWNRYPIYAPYPEPYSQSPGRSGYRSGYRGYPDGGYRDRPGYPDAHGGSPHAKPHPGEGHHQPQPGSHGGSPHGSHSPGGSAHGGHSPGGPHGTGGGPR